MSKIKATLWVVLSLCFFGLLIWGSIGFSNLNSNSNSGKSKKPNSNQNLAPTSESSLVSLSSGQSGKNSEKQDNDSDSKIIPPTPKEESAENLEIDQVQVSTSASPNGDQVGGILDSQSITSCSVAMEILPSLRSTKQWIYPRGNGSTQKVEVLCDFQVDGGGWTVIQKRTSGPRQEFNKNWSEYSNGFGSLDRNFWIGLENIHALTRNGDQELRIDLEDFEGDKSYAKYSNFSISDASDFYRLSLSGFNGNSTARDSMTNSVLGHSNFNVNGMTFSTNVTGCFVSRSGGWWFQGCGTWSNLNGDYRRKGEEVSFWKSIAWGSVTEDLQVAKTEMKIRERK